jgi:hypothetical protein
VFALSSLPAAAALVLTANDTAKSVPHGDIDDVGRARARSGQKARASDVTDPAFRMNVGGTVSGEQVDDKNSKIPLEQACRAAHTITYSV